MFDRKIGVEGSVLQEFCDFVIRTIWCCNMANSALFVQSAPPRAFSASLLFFAYMLQTYIESVPEDV